MKALIDPFYKTDVEDALSAFLYFIASSFITFGSYSFYIGFKSEPDFVAFEAILNNLYYLFRFVVTAFTAMSAVCSLKFLIIFFLKIIPDPK